VIVLYPYDVGRTVCVERVGANPFGFAKAAYPAPLFSAIHCVAEWHTPQASYAKTLDVGSTLIHSSVLYCFALLICITQRKVSSFFLLLHPSLCSVCKGQEERVCCAALFLLLYSVQLRFTKISDEIFINCTQISFVFITLHYITFSFTSLRSSRFIPFRSGT
jgi:hypothetical protein